MKIIYNLFTTGACMAFMLAFMSCENSESKDNENQTTVNSKKTVEIAPLIPRQASVGAPGEWEKMHTIYLETKAQIERTPDDYASRLKMADLYIVEARATGNYGYYYPAAVHMIDGVLAENPQSTDDQFRALTSKAVILLSLHKFEEALEMGEKAVAINPYNSRVYGILTDANVELGNYSKAVVMADSMVGIRPDLRSYSRVSYLREIFGDIKGAQDAMMMAVKAGYPGHEETSWSRVTLGNLYENYGDLSQAEMQYRTALEGRSDYPFALAGLASVEAKKGNLQEAVDQMNGAIKIRPEASFYEKLSHYHKMMGNNEKADDARAKALETLRGLSGTSETHGHGSEDAHGHGHDNGHAHDQGHDHGAEHSKDHDHDAKADAHGHSHETGLEMAMMQLSLTEDYDEALHNALHEYSTRPDNVDVNEALAHAYLKTGKMKQAQEHYEKATATGSKDPELLMIGGMIKLRNGAESEGKAMIKRSLEANPYQIGPLANEARKIDI